MTSSDWACWSLSCCPLGAAVSPVPISSAFGGVVWISHGCGVVTGEELLLSAVESLQPGWFWWIPSASCQLWAMPPYVSHLFMSPVLCELVPSHPTSHGKWGLSRSGLWCLGAAGSITLTVPLERGNRAGVWFRTKA